VNKVVRKVVKTRVFDSESWKTRARNFFNTTSLPTLGGYRKLAVCEFQRDYFWSAHLHASDCTLHPTGNEQFARAMAQIPDDKPLEPESGAFVLDDPNTDVISVVDDTMDLPPVSHRGSKNVGENLPFPHPRDTGKKRQKVLLESEKLALLVSSYIFRLV
jgi:hypothetical protein